MTLTDQEKQAYARVGTNIITIWAIELRHSSFPAILRLVNYDLDVDHTLEASAPVDASTQVTFVATAFTFEPPKLNGEAQTGISASIDGVSGAIQPYLAAANQTNEAIECTIRELQYDTAADAVLFQPATYHLRVTQAPVSMTSVTIEASRINSANQAFPNIYYTPQSNPGLL